MGYITNDIALIPIEGREWFVFMLDDYAPDDPMRLEVRGGFDFLVAKTGPKALIIKGTNRDYLFRQVYELYNLESQKFEFERFPLPALLVTDTAPEEVINNPDALEKAKMIVFPLGERYAHPGDITEFFRELLIALKDPSAMLALDDLNESTIKEKWSWLSEYFECTPHFLGFDIKVNKIIQDFFLE